VDVTGTGKTGRGVLWVADAENKGNELRSCVNSMKNILTTIRYTYGCHRSWENWSSSWH